MTEERATVNAIDDTRQLFDARLETLEAKIDGKLALIFQRLDAMPDRAEMHKAISDAVSETTRATHDLRKLIIWGSVAACGSILSLMFAARALNIDALGVGFDVAQIIVDRDRKHEEEMRLMRKMIVDNANFLHKLREELLQRSAPGHP
jgi:hypothetical protein